MGNLDKIEALLTQCEEDLLALTKVNSELEKIEINIRQLTKYYQTQYAKDIEEYKDSDTHYRALDEDSIWNVINGQYTEKIRLLKTIVSSI